MYDKFRMSLTLWFGLVTTLAWMPLHSVDGVHSEISVAEGERIEVVCTTNAKDDMEWIHNSDDVERLRLNDTRYVLGKSQAGIGASVINTLHISDARLEDSGQVRCRDVNDVFSDFSTATIKVTRNEANKPRLTVDPPGAIFLSRPGSLLRLNCSGVYSSKPTWFLSNQRLEETIDTTITHVLDVITLRHHVILTCDGMDNTGTYQCIDEEKIMRKSLAVVVSVKESGTKQGQQESPSRPGLLSLASNNSQPSNPSTPIKWVRKMGSSVRLKCDTVSPGKSTNVMFLQKRGLKKPIFVKRGSVEESVSADYANRLFNTDPSSIEIRQLRIKDEGWYRCSRALVDSNFTWIQLVIKAELNIVRPGPPANATAPRSRVRRVIGGTSYAEGKWPWLVSLQGKVPNRMFFGIPLSYKHFYCGASLLNERWVMTAAHCFPDNYGSRGTAPKYWHARLGEVGLRRGTIERLRDWIGRVFEVGDLRHFYLHATKVFLHPQYDKNRMWLNDIALLKLEEDVPSGEDINPFVRSIGLNTVNNISFPSDGQECVMKGWGCTANGGGVATSAREVTMPKVSDVSCGQFWGIPASTRLCAGYSSAFNLGICSGDSGGPLVCHNRVDWVQVGIASFTSATRPEQVPGVFTRVSSYVPWINDVIANN